MKKVLVACVLFLVFVGRSSPAPLTRAQVLGALDTGSCSGSGLCDLKQGGQSAVNAGFFSSPNGSLTYSNFASSAYGVLNVASQSSFSLVNATQAWAYGFAGFEDTLTINFPGLTGQTGQLLMGYTLDGFISGSGVSTNFLLVVSRVIHAAGACNSVTVQCFNDIYTDDVAGTFVHPFTFTFGTPFDLVFDLQASTGTLNVVGGGYSIATRSGQGSGNVDFTNTFVLTKLTVKDQDGNLVPGATFTAQSGTLYTSNGVVQPVPEPTSLALLFVGIAGFAGVRVRYRRGPSRTHRSVL